MAYCTVSFYEQFFPRIDNIRFTDDSGAGVENHGLIQIVLDSGASLIDSFIGLLVRLPLSEPYPMILQVMNAKIGRRELANRLGRVSIEIKEDYDGIVKMLTEFRDRKLSLPQELMASQTMGQVMSYSPAPLYTERILAHA